ncbi:ras-related and estrogen-regulated growth inhibitor-like isoform X1 [Macrobrachium nipponense]|uniref:ras-related and estrogen-regulated growth inhibitor-like isoform X1 n=2 Tax=Macrobrachium nipponense TaxID=159736 RepID=UPI0030C7CE18
MSSKAGTVGLLRPSSAILSHKSESRAHSKERHRKTSMICTITPASDGITVSSMNSGTAIHTTTANSSTTSSTSATTASSKTTASSVTNNNSSRGNTIINPPPPTIIKTPAPNKNNTSSPLLHGSSPHTRPSSGSSGSNSGGGSGSNNQNRSSSITTTHLSPWSGPTTYTSNSNNKKTNATADSRLVVVGYPAVGKSALVVRLLTGRFIWEYDPTLEAAYRHHTTIDDDTAVLDILDTAGQCEGVVNEAHARWGDGFILTFSLTDRRSFSAVKEIHDAIASARQSPNFSCVVVANKTDLRHLAEVSEDEASEVAGEIGASLFLTSACDGGPSIQAAFSELHRDVIRRRWTRRRRSSAKTVIEGFYKMFTR